MTNLENLGNFLLQEDIDTINAFIGEPLAINVDKNSEDVDESTRSFLYRLANKIRAIESNKNCLRNCFFRKNSLRRII